MQQKPLILALLASLSLSGAAQATLNDRGGGLIYDDVLNVTWLQDANYAKTSGYDAYGRMTWANATAWAANLVYGGYSDWRLPTMIDTDGPDADALGNDGFNFAYSGTDGGYNVQTVSGSTVYSEMAHMYFNNLGLKSRYNPDGSYNPAGGIFGNGTSSGQNNVGLIDNLQSYEYWSGLEYAPVATSAWGFGTRHGYQSAGFKYVGLYAWAVRPGDVAAVPEADTWAMLLAGLGLVGVAARRRRG